MEIRPAIDIIEGRCVRLKHGDYSQKKIYDENPIEVAKRFEGEGMTHLHLVDLDGAIANHIVNYQVIEGIANATNLTIDFGGGLKSTADVEVAFNSGVSQITGGSIAVKDDLLFFEWLERWGADKIILGADALNDYVAINGWKENTALNLYELIEEYTGRGVQHVISTDISKDGALEGPAFAMYENILKRTPNIHLIASGGVTTMEDVERLEAIGCAGVIIGKAIYEGNINLEELAKKYVAC